MTEPNKRLVAPEETFSGEAVSLRLVTLDDCTSVYVSWLEDPDVNMYLETRFSRQTLASVRDFVSGMIDGPTNYLFAIIEIRSGSHIGNIKVGPINRHHRFADVSYFIGDKACWGRGYATEAIKLAARVAFERLGVRRLQAGLYEGNVGSARALEGAGFAYEARFGRQLQGPDGLEDHLWYVRFAEGDTGRG